MKHSTNRSLAVVALLVSATLAACGGSKGQDASAVKSVDDIVSMVADGDGFFRVTCRDGRVERRSASEIRADRVCVQGGGGGDGLLRCVARDNDGRDPWILARISADGSIQRFPEFVFSTLSSCQTTANSAVSVGFDTRVFCSARDRDGRDPWSLAVMTGSSAQLATGVVYGTLSQCQSAMSSARVSRTFMLTCASRDADGRDPWVYLTVNDAGQVNLQRDATYGTLSQCLGSL